MFPQIFIERLHIINVFTYPMKFDTYVPDSHTDFCCTMSFFSLFSSSVDYLHIFSIGFREMSHSSPPSGGSLIMFQLSIIVSQVFVLLVFLLCVQLLHWMNYECILHVCNLINICEDWEKYRNKSWVCECLLFPLKQQLDRTPSAAVLLSCLF